MSGLKILYNLILKDAARGSGQASGIMSIGPDIRKTTMNKYARYVDSAKRQGVDLDKLSEQEIKYMLELNKPKGPTIGGHEVIGPGHPRHKEITNDLFNMLDRQSGKNVIKTDFGKPFAEEIVTVERVITDIKKMKPMDSMKEANKVLKGEGRYKNLSKADREKIVDDESVTDHIFERNIEPDPEDFAQGGRTGLSYLLAEDTNVRMPMWMGGGLGAGKGLLKEMLKYFSKGSKHGKSPTEMLKLVNPKQFNEMLDRPEGIPTLAKEMIEGYTETLKKDRALTIDEIISSAKNIKKAEDAITSHKQWMIKDMVKKGIDKETAEMFSEGLSKSMAKVGPQDAPKITEQGLLELENIYKNLITKDRPLNAEGGRIPFKLGGIDKMRRLFLQMVGAGAATAGAAKSGLFGLLKGGGKKQVAKELTQVPIKNIEGMPAWFKPLVNKVIKEGKEVDSGAERVIVHKTKLPNSKTDVYVTQELDTGNVVADIGIDKHGFADGKFGQPVRLEYKAAEEIEPILPQHMDPKDPKGFWKPHKAQKTKEEFWVEEAEFTGGHPENIKFEESSFNKFGEHQSDFREVEEFAIGKNTIKGQIGGKSKPRPVNQKDIDFASGGVARMLGE